MRGLLSQSGLLTVLSIPFFLVDKCLHFAVTLCTITCVMASKSIQVRLDERLKKRVEKIFAEIGVDTPTAVRMFFMKVAATGEIPFPLKAYEEDHYTPKQLKALDHLAEQAMKGKGVSRAFTSMDELIEDLHS